MRLYKELKNTGYHSSIISTFNVDISFYDQVVQHHLRSVGCSNNILLVDANMWRLSLGLEAVAPKNIGQSYLLWPVDASLDGGQSYSCFHPKLFLQLGRRRGRLIVGSANMTLQGYSHNLEILSEIAWNDRDQGASATASRAIICQAYDYLCGFLNRDVPSVEQKLTQIERETPWLEAASSATSPFDLEDDLQVGMLVSRSTLGGIANRFAEWVGGDQINRLSILSPYWNEKLDAAKYLQVRFGGIETNLLLQPKTVSFPAPETEANNFTLRNFSHSNSADGRFVHAKLIIAEGELYDYVLAGSANCSFAALGSESHSGLNHEVSVFRRLPSGWAKESLGLDSASYEEVNWEDLGEQYVAEEHISDAASKPPIPGMVEISGRSLMWWPHMGIAAEGAECILLDEANEVASVLNSEPQSSRSYQLFVLPESDIKVSKVKFQLADGSETLVAYAHHRDMLRKVSRGYGGSSIQKAMETLQTGEADALAFLNVLHRLKSEEITSFDLKELRTPRQGEARAGAPEGRPEDDVSEKQTTPFTMDEFLKGRERATITSTGRSGIVSAHDATFADLLDMLRHVSFGHGLVPDISDNQPDIDDSIYEDELPPEEVENFTESPEPIVPEQDVAEAPEEIDGDRLAAIRSAREKLDREVEAFSQRLRETAKQEAVSNRVSLELWLHLIMLTLGIRMIDGDRLLTCDPKDNAGYFPRLAAKLIQYFYVHPQPSVFGKIELDPGQDVLSDDVFDLVALSIWVLCLSVAIDMKLGKGALSKILTPVANTLYSLVKHASVIIDPESLKFRLQELNHHQSELPLDAEEILKVHACFMSGEGG